MAEQIVKLDSTTPRGVYLHSIAAVPGTVAEQTFITLMNPVGSGRVMTLGTIALSYSNTSPATVVDPVRGWRISAHSGGSLVAASGIGKFSTTMPNATAEVRSTIRPSRRFIQSSTLRRQSTTGLPTFTPWRFLLELRS
ncbi:hypothetical protein [Streptomyces phage JXY1]|uniref:Uncharacterized protein n=1 Tax=Streptomyces phage JXY1 TaxID=2708562 RepID=A0A6C0RS65_9CAUD|nr:hypothetical protein HWD10_gp02 [Streptomyces phage JXY1]QIA28795.1 hypothetical protein [Streptomyces phage JXY1]